MSCDVFMSVPSFESVESVLWKNIQKQTTKTKLNNSLLESERDMAKYFKSRLKYIHEPELSENRA